MKVKMVKEILAPAKTNIFVIWLNLAPYQPILENFEQQKMLCVWVGRAKPNQCVETSATGGNAATLLKTAV